MSAELHVYSEMPALSWEEFIKTYPLGSIALDGYVIGAPRYESHGPYLNADHHAGVDRLSTLSTAQQIFMKIQMGLRQAFTKEGDFAPHVYTNDCDQDIGAAWFLLHNIAEAERSSPALTRFIDIAGKLDVTAGAYPCDLQTHQQLGWVFEPYTLFKASGEMKKRNNDQYKSTIYAMEGRIHDYLRGKGGSIQLDLRYKVVGGGPTWTMIEEIGKDGRIGAFIDGIKAYVIVKELGEGRWLYTIGRASEFIAFDVAGSLRRLNKLEDCILFPWGGSNNVGGGPRRPEGSALSPRVVAEEVNIANYGSTAAIL